MKSRNGIKPLVIVIKVMIKYARVLDDVAGHDNVRQCLPVIVRVGADR